MNRSISDRTLLVLQSLSPSLFHSVCLPLSLSLSLSHSLLSIHFENWHVNVVAIWALARCTFCLFSVE